VLKSKKNLEIPQRALGKEYLTRDSNFLKEILNNRWIEDEIAGINTD